MIEMIRRIRGLSAAAYRRGASATSSLSSELGSESIAEAGPNPTPS
jgi:hypothetical protein